MIACRHPSRPTWDAEWAFSTKNHAPAPRLQALEPKYSQANSRGIRDRPGSGLYLHEPWQAFETRRLSLEVFGGADARVPDRRVAGPLGIFPIPRCKLTQSFRLMTQDFLRRIGSR
jgi:hypothetical protein